MTQGNTGVTVEMPKFKNCTAEVYAARFDPRNKYRLGDLIQQISELPDGSDARWQAFSHLTEALHWLEIGRGETN